MSPSNTLRLDRARLEAPAGARDLFSPIIDASPARPYVVAQLGQSLDGRIATPTGASRWINGNAALDHLHRLRAHVDAVVVGAKTVLADDPLLTVRRVAGRQPARVVIDPNARVPGDARCFAADGTPCMVIRKDNRATAGRAEPIVVYSDETGQIAPQAIAAALHARGFKKILVEGGASTVSAFLDAGAVDRLHLLIAPVILGSGITGLSLQPIGGLEEAVRPRATVHVLDDGDVLFDCDVRRNA